ncbi:uncharacterized protein ASCRUDRAFT_82672 [Ascoidea rubescens DSM 1968]|uniref:Uncharacterized protein n=1 Tax=Ascoidea rubescens DSM 1968 TaxID=1344418 RepID=A0A1D2VA76_9ASCO|nr:hypothetical protein ASCRUDRAFT_82672 [Ascoidea rubescens DSM 1968]ODV58511.1 hypothetical protein ASCRUDRAFT_82672 [Ascoidea rubescens DSM 1968]
MPFGSKFSVCGNNLENDLVIKLMNKKKSKQERVKKQNQPSEIINNNIRIKFRSFMKMS